MSWLADMIIPEKVKKRGCVYLIQRYLGQFFEEKLTRDQLNVDFYNGTGTIEKISLDVQALNDLGEKQNWPMEFVDGSIEKLHLYIPWTNFLKESSFVEVRGLKLTVQPKQRQESATSMFESMWNSMTSSLQLAAECAKQEDVNAAIEQTYDGIKSFAQSIDSILSRVKVKLIDTVIQVEHVPKDSKTGVGIVINIDLIEYSDEAGDDPCTDEATDSTKEDSKKAYCIESYSTKRFIIKGIALSTVEFSNKARTFNRSVLTESQNFDTEQEDSLVTILENSSINSRIEDADDVDDDYNTSKKEKVENTVESSLDSDRHVVLFAKFSDQQEIKVRLKDSENLIGPKVSIEANLKTLKVFLSPRQLQILIELANGLASPDIEDVSNVTARPKCTSKPMTGLDYQRVEQELQQQLQPMPSLQMGGLQSAGRGWSAALDESDTEDNFLEMKSMVSTMFDSALSGINSSMESSVTSSVTSWATNQTHRTRKTKSNIDSDPTAEISHFQIHISSLVAVLLHKDLLVQPTDLTDLTSTKRIQILEPSSVQKMQQTAEHFFKNLNNFVLTSCGSKEFDGAKTAFEKACNLNHIRLTAGPIEIDGREKTTFSALSRTGELTAARLEVLECLYMTPDGPVEYVPLLRFTETSSVQTTRSFTGKSNFKLVFIHAEKTAKNVAFHRSSGPKTDMVISLDKCIVDFDITIVDRATALLNPPTICVIEKSKHNPWDTSHPTVPSQRSSSQESRFDLKIKMPSLYFKLRFPIPDFRPLSCRNPWWERHIRPDYLSLTLLDAMFQSTFHSNQTFQEYNVQCRGFDIFYYETENSAALPIAKGGFCDKYASSMMQDALLQSRLSIKIFPDLNANLDDSNDSEQDPLSMSFKGVFENENIKHPGLFGAKKVVYESEATHSKEPKDESEELIMPGDKPEIDKFIENTTKSSKIHVDVCLTKVSVQFVSKHIYEVLYNRINNDLLLWKPSAPTPETNIYLNSHNSSRRGMDSKLFVEGEDMFEMCASAAKYDSDSDSDSSGSNGTFFSTYNYRTNLLEDVEFKKKPQSSFVLNLQIWQGLLCMNPPVRDAATNNVIPGQQGEFLFNIENANIFVVNGYKGDEDLGYVCLQVSNVQLYHCDMISVPNVSPSLKEIGTPVAKHLHPTIYKSETGMLTNAMGRGGSREMLTVSIKIETSYDTHPLKNVQVAVGVNKGTLRHRMCSEPNTWISHLIDIFKTQDYVVLGYIPSQIVTKCHLHLWDCAIDYRPLHLPLRSAITIGNFSMASNILEETNESVLRFIFEECGLFLSDKGPPKNGVASSTSVDLKRDYVGVIELGLFELGLKTRDKNISVGPYSEIRAFNNIVHIRTCADSARALMDIISYFANNGDVVSPPPPAPTGSAFSSPSHHAEQELVSLEPQAIIQLSDSQHQHVNSLLDEAMREYDSGVSEEVSDKAEQYVDEKLFCFPDEPRLSVEPYGKPHPQVTSELGDITYLTNKSSDTDDEFCFVGNESGLLSFPKSGNPEVRWLTCDPVRIVDDHFSLPTEKPDPFKPPKHFPTPTERYTLSKMTVVWQMYGGNDFRLEKNSGKKTVNFADTQMFDSVSFSNSDRDEVIFNSKSDKKRANIRWEVKGGVNRDLGVLMELQLSKVRFQYEVYPENTVQASRQVLIISDVEIRDRLEISEINKFLYGYTSQDRPKQTYSHMVVIKALHIRADPKLPTQECCLKVSLLPLRLNIDQDSLLFLIKFFTGLGGGKPTDTDEEGSSSSKHSTPTHHPPVMAVDCQNEDIMKIQALKVINEMNDNLILLMEENTSQQQSNEAEASTSRDTSDSSPVYFRNVVFSPEVLVRFDYNSRRIDMSHGPVPGVLMGLMQVNCSELRLKRIIHRQGLLGFEKLVNHLLAEWVNDITKNQIPSLLGGIGPMQSFVHLYQGFRDLFCLPIEQYQKDGRIFRGLQRGANVFTWRLTYTLLDLSSILLQMISATTATVHDILSPGPTARRIPKSRGRRKKYRQPQDIREGLANAYMIFKEGITETSDNIMQVVSREKEQKGLSGALGGVIRQVPPAMVTPFMLASQATCNILGGMKSQLVPDARREANQKWRSDDI